MRFILLFAATFLSIQSINFAQNIQKDYDISFNGNYRIYPSNVSQTEVFIVTHPTNPDILFSSANTLVFNPFFVSEGIYVSTDGGTSWRGSDTCNGQPINFHGGDPGIVIDKNGTFILTRLSSLTGAGLYSHYSTDNGLTWSNQKSIDEGDLERATLASDVTPTSNYFGRTYATWVKFAPPFPVLLCYTDDGAQNWSEPIQVNNPVQRSAGGEISMGLNGDIYVCWAGVTDVSPFTEDFIGFAHSSNGGANWNVTENAFDANGITGQLSEKGNIRVNGLPRIDVDTTGGPRNGWIYIITTQKNLAPAGTDPDVILNRSTDGGQSWSPGIRVNQDALNNGAIQYFPAVHVDKYGGLNVLFYDDRNTTSDSTGVFLARSDDGGDTWREFEISDHNFKPIPIGGLGQGYQGDNISITSTNDKLFPVWMDNSSGTYQNWSVTIDISTVDVQDETNLPDEYVLTQNFPNPFNPVTNITLQLPESGFVSLKVYDVIGNEAAVIVNESLSRGRYTYKFDATGLTSGIYFYQITTENFTDTKKMLLIK